MHSNAIGSLVHTLSVGGGGCGVLGGLVVLVILCRVLPHVKMLTMGRSKKIIAA